MKKLLKLSKLYVKATIPLKIRSFSNLIKNFIPNLERKYNSIIDGLKKPDHVSEEDWEDYCWDYCKNNEVKHFIKKLEKDLKKIKEFEYNIDYIKNAKSHNFPEAVRYLVDNLGWFIEDAPFGNALNYLREDLGRLNERYNDHFENSKDEIGGDKFWKTFISLPDDYEKIINYIISYRDKLKEHLNHRARYINEGQETPPKSENVETLYHATINADKINSSGFIKDYENTEGLGGSVKLKSGKPGISFTADLYVAKEVARCLKEAIMICNDEIDANDILEWSKDKDQLLDSLKSINNHKDLTSKVAVFDLYKIYLAYNRYDPVFFGSSENFINIFSGKSTSDVGIIAASVDMTNKDIMYLSSMEEYRVPVESVLSIEKVIR